MTVLFSPIGTADPITQLGDGPMLHIARHYRPDRIYLFLSPKMTGYQDADQRYTKAIELLYQSLDEPLPKVELIRSKNVEVHRFDTFIQEYEDCLGRVMKECHIKRNSEEKILVNASSGTPAMEQAAVALGALGWLPLQLIQVPTPRGGTNQKGDRESPDDYDLDLLWACNPDNDQGRPCRVHAVELPNLRDRIVREDVITLVESYDYEAALQVSKESAGFPQQARSLISAALNRLNLASASKNEDMLARYLWSLEIKCKRGLWADFVRAMTPAVMETMERVLDPVLPREKYLCEEGGAYANVLSLSRIEQDAQLSALFSWYLGRSGKQYLNNKTLMSLVENYCQDKPEVVEKLRTIRTFEEGSRNLFAHELRKVEKDEIEREGKASFKEVMDLLFEVNGVREGKFDCLNQQIVSLIKRG